MPHLEITLAGGKPATIRLPDNANSDDELRAFLEQRGPYGQRWIAINGGDEYVRYDQIVHVKLAR